MAHPIESVEEYNSIIASNKAVFVDYYAQWCKPCGQIAPHIDAFQKKYPNIKIIKVDFDEFDSIVQDEKIEKLPTFKAFFEGEVIGTQIGVKLDQLEALIGQLTSRLPKPDDAYDSPIAAAEEVSNMAPVQQQPKQQQQSAETTKPNMPAAHPALAIQNDGTIAKGSASQKHITPAPQELAELKNSLEEYSIVIFSHESQQPSQSSTVSSPIKSSLSSNVVTQLMNDMKLLQGRFSDINPIQLQHVVLIEGDAKSDVLKYEFGLEKAKDAPIIKMFYKKIVFATIMNANAYEVEAKLPDFVRL